MPETFSQVLALPGLELLVFAAVLSGMVRGFSGFGTAMIFLPFAAQVVPPIWAILALIGMDMFGPIPVLRRAAKDADWRDLKLLIITAGLGAPLGVWLLTIISPESYRYIICSISLVLVVLLLSGLRYPGKPTPRAVMGAGALAGTSGGLSGIPGPPIILLYMASAVSVSTVRANIMLFLFAFEFVLIGLYWASGQASFWPFVLGVVLAVPNGLGTASTTPKTNGQNDACPDAQ